ncbi:MAG TPA: O-antigen ligase family protein [Candidatus Saccharimonadales bacterium]|nr:O-antigen ligase family protein [Candidatus Saccharimonadales bacterium]
MKKFLSFLDNSLLKISIAFAILFVPLYPKLPSVGIPHVWVYIRLEDFLILLVTAIWLVQLIRKKVSLPRPEGYALVVYWAMGLISLIYCLIFIASHLANFFPQIAVLEYLRRIEYMILFFAAFSSVKKPKDVTFYLITLGVALSLITLYGFGQKFYTTLWLIAPAFFKQYPYCFPAYLTGNEEFAKGVPFCLNSLSRIASTFGGNYDLSTYLAVVIPLFIALFIAVKRIKIKVLIAILVILSLELLNFTSSRTSFAAYLFGAITMLILWKKKLWIIPVVIVSIGVLFLLSTATIQRFAKTVQPVQIVQVQPGADQSLEKIISKTQQTQANKAPQTPAPGTVTVGSGAENGLASGSGQVLTNADIQSLQDQNIDISSVSGSFLLRKAYALDISFTTRFQAEWPRDWQAFMSSPIFGTGYSSLTLASDNDYLRALGETGLVGAISFLFIFLIFGIFAYNALKTIKDPIIRALLFGLIGGVVGLLANAVLIDVFEASKVAESLWILLGIGLGAAKLYHKEPIPYKKSLIAFFTSRAMISLYIIILVIAAFITSIANFFVADDFTWLHWAASAATSDLPKYFVQSQGFFYRPLDKAVTYFLYMIFSFQPQGYHLTILFIHMIMSIGVFFLAMKLTKNKLVSVLATLLFVLHPAHTENIFWFSTLSDDLSSTFIVYMMIAFMNFREKKSVIAYIVSILFAALAFVSYEISPIVPFVLIALDIFILKPKKNSKTYLSYVPFVILFILYFVMRYVSHAFSGGGDYSYHLSKILPNMVGNFFGYTGMFLGGLPFIQLYNFLRGGLRTEWIYFTVILILVIVYVYWMFRSYRSKVRTLWHRSETQLLIFCIVFAGVSLLPFLPLGNIAPRYLYLASAGYAIALVYALQLLFVSWMKVKKYAVWSLIVVCVVLGVVYFVSDRNEQRQWERSGDLTQNTLLFFRKNYNAFTITTDLYFVNTPITQNGTWVFPVGLSDGLWFIYREKMPQVHEVGSVQEAVMDSRSNKDSHIFQFDRQGNISEVKQ